MKCWTCWRKSQIQSLEDLCENLFVPWLLIALSLYCMTYHKAGEELRDIVYIASSSLFLAAFVSKSNAEGVPTRLERRDQRRHRLATLRRQKPKTYEICRAVYRETPVLLKVDHSPDYERRNDWWSWSKKIKRG